MCEKQVKKKGMINSVYCLSNKLIFRFGKKWRSLVTDSVRHHQHYCFIFIVFFMYSQLTSHYYYILGSLKMGINVFHS